MAQLREVVETVDVRAPIAAVWEAVSDPAGYSRWSPESTGAVRRTGSGPWAVGDRFTGRNRLWLPWTTSCRVVACDPEREFAFDVTVGPLALSRWAYEVEALPDSRGESVRVTERWTDLRDGAMGTAARPIGLFVGRGVDAAARNRVTMRATLDAMRADLELNNA